MTEDETLGGYAAVHRCPPGFHGIDGRSYSAEAFIDDCPDESGRFGAAIMFIRWSEDAQKPDGHLETEYLAYGETADLARADVESLKLQEVKEHLDRLIGLSNERPRW